MEEIKYSFEKLEVWKISRELVFATYKLLESFPKTEQHKGLCDQIRRAAVSVPSNIAEGCGRISVKEKMHFIEIAYGSLMETYCQLILAKDLNFISDEQLTTVKPSIHQTSKLLSGLRASYLRQLNSKP